MTHSIAATLALVDRIRAIAHDRTLEPGDALRRIRDEFAAHNEGGMT